MRHRQLSWAAFVWIIAAMFPWSAPAETQQDPLREQALTAMRRATEFYRDRVAVHGGYVYHYSLDLQQRMGEGVATPQQIWVQPPGTPAVGSAFLAAYRATGEARYLDAAREAARALVYGQLESGGWTNSIDFDPQSPGVARYRNGKGRGRNTSTLDDDITQSALRFLMRIDQALDFKDAEIHRTAESAREALLQAQYPNGGFPQVWEGPVPPQPVVPANYPDYDWRTENRIKAYWNLYTLNDGVTGHVADTLLDGLEIYGDQRCAAALVKLGDFLILAQLPDPQPAWAQQYDFQMRPVWARKFEPPAVAGRESEDAIETLLKIARHTGDAKYLAPIPRALAYLKKSRLPDGRLARYYELKTNKPLYMTEKYELTHDDAHVPAHYGWKTTSHVDTLERQFRELQAGGPKKTKPRAGSKKSEDQVREVVRQLDDQGRWTTEYTGDRLVGQPKLRAGERFLSSAVFCHNLELLSNYVAEPRP
jgi:PelA/Pel-15E family pectate lyase